MRTQTTDAPRPVGLSEQDRHQILGMPERHGPLTLAAEWDAMNEDYADDVLVLMPGLPDLRGKAALRSFQDGFPPVTAYEAHIDELDGCGDVAYARLKYRYEAEVEGSTFAETGRGVWILRKDAGGRWRVVLDIINSDQAPTPPGEP